MNAAPIPYPRARQTEVEAAWSLLCAPWPTETQVVAACETVIQHCRDGRRDQAALILKERRRPRGCANTPEGSRP